MPLNASCSLIVYRKHGLFWSLWLPNVSIASGVAGGLATIRGVGAGGYSGGCGGAGMGAGAVLGGVSQVTMGLSCCGAVWPCPSGLGLGVGNWASTGSREGGRVRGRLERRLEGRLEGRPDHSEASLLGVSVPSGVSGLGLGLRLGNAMVLAVPSGVSAACYIFAFDHVWWHYLLCHGAGFTCAGVPSLLCYCVLCATWLGCHCCHHVEGCAGPLCCCACSQVGRKQGEPADVISQSMCYMLLPCHVICPTASDLPDPQSPL
jgi:hypothetical protein